MFMDDEHCYRAASSRDGRFDGLFVTAVTTTKIYCRPSCPAMTPKRAHMRFYPTPAAAQEAGFRACKRCRPDAAPGSPEWDSRADLAARAMRLIGDGVVEREGIPGLAARLGYSSRQLNRLVFNELGTGPLRLALAHRVQHARTLLETTDLPMSDVAWASGFGSIRQFNDRIRQVYALSPTEIRRAATRGRTTASQPGFITVRLSYRPPIDLPGLLAFLGQRAIPGVESYDGHTYSRVLRLPHGMGVAVVPALPVNGWVPCELRLDDVRDFSTAVARMRRLLDLDADPRAVAATLTGDELLGPLIDAAPGRRVPGAVDGPELAFRALLGQQVSVAGARTLAARLAEQWGETLDEPCGSLKLAFPSAERLAGVRGEELPLPARRAQALLMLAREIADGRLVVDPGADRDRTETTLVGLPGIGPWTASYVRMRGLGDPDVFMAGDLAVKRALEGRAGIDADRWRPWRSYATVHLWASGHPSTKNQKEKS
jgi:AraC family transcriptional regulator of adaptative response / DNA-3-methyladenine glycosylase II